MSSGPLLEVRDLRVAFGSQEMGTEVLRGVSFTVEEGERVAIVGRSGSGKTQILLSIMDLVRGLPGRVAGSVRLRRYGGSMVEVDSEAAGSLRGGTVGMVFQHPQESLVPWKRVGAQLDQVRRRWRMTRSLAANQELLESLGFREPDRILRAWPHELSGGEAQRVAIALATLPAPTLLLADEPTSALDAIIQRRVLRILTDQVRRDGSSLLLVSHDLALVSEVVDRVLVLADGMIVADEPPHVLAGSDPDGLHPDAAELMQAVRTRVRLQEV